MVLLCREHKMMIRMTITGNTQREPTDGQVCRQVDLPVVPFRLILFISSFAMFKEIITSSAEALDSPIKRLSPLKLDSFA